MGHFRKLLVAMAALSIVVLSSILIAKPYLRPQPYGQASAIFALIVIIAGGRHVWRWPSWHALALPLAGASILPAIVVANHFGNFDVLSVVHHLRFGGDGPGFEVFNDEISDGLIVLTCFALGAFWLRNVLAASGKWFWLAGFVMAVINPMSVSVGQLVLQPKADLDLVARLGPPLLIASDVRPDVIIVYLEGLDQAFADQAIYGDAYAGLLPVRAEGFDVTQVGQIAGTGWSIAGVVASQCGVPLLPNGMRQRNDFAAQSEFLPSQTCLSDILAERGYETSFVVGADARFAGQSHFLRSHQVDTIVDRTTIAQDYDAAVFSSAFVEKVQTYDDALAFDMARRHYDSLIRQPAPIALSIMTFGPHGESGVLSRHCASDGRARLEPDLRLTVACTISDFLPFLDHIRANRAGRPTLVAVLSDHLNHKRDVAAQATRMNTVTFLGLGIDDFPSRQMNTRRAAMIDVYPTMLALLGLADPDVAAGLGQSLLGTTPTLVEQYGIAGLDRALETNLDLRLALWR